MKFFSFITVAVLCATAVTAAPQSPNFPFIQKFGVSNIIEDILGNIGQNVQQYWENIQCIRDVITQVVGDSELKDVWTEAKTAIDQTNVEWHKCDEVQGIVGKQKCRFDVVGKNAAVLNGFIQKLVTELRINVLAKIQQKAVAECLNKEEATFFDLEIQNEVEAYQGSIAEQFECLVDVLEDVSKRNDLDELWARSEPQLRDRLSKWKDCANVDNRILQIICNVKNSVGTYKLVNEYLQLVAAEKPQVVQEIAREVQRKCSGQAVVRVAMIQAETLKGIEKIKCITEAINEAVKGSDYSNAWDEYKQQLVEAGERIKACKASSNKPLEVVTCITKEVKATGEILSKSLASLKQKNAQAYAKAKELIRTNCFA